MGSIELCDRRKTWEALSSLLENHPEDALSLDLQYNRRTHKYYVLFKYRVVRGPDTIHPEQQKIVSADIGATCAFAVSTPRGIHGDILHGIQEVIISIHQKIADIQSRMAGEADGRKWSRLRNHLQRVCVHLQNVVKQVHYDAIKQLFAMGDLIICPHLSISNMVKRGHRVFGPATAKILTTMSPYKFTARLISKVQTTANKSVLFPRESGTTGSCDFCGCWNPHVGAAKTFECPCCGHKAERDAGHAARANGLAPLPYAHGLSPTRRSGCLDSVNCGHRAHILDVEPQLPNEPGPAPYAAGES